MSTENEPVAPALRAHLRTAGLTQAAIDAVWPEWWTAEAEGSLSAQTELRFTVARRLGIHPSSLFEESPRFVWRDDARFKNLGNIDETQQAVLASFGLALGRTLLAGTPEPGTSYSELGAARLRQAILARSPVVGLGELLAFAWALGIPVAKTVVFPFKGKHMHAMSVRHQSRHAVILGLRTNYPARIAFTLAHELGHILLGHMGSLSTFLDYGDPLTIEADDEESAADRFALELLTGSPSPQIVPQFANFGAQQLAVAALEASGESRIDAGVIALCVGFLTKRWREATGALKVLGPVEGLPEQINALAASELDWQALPMGSASYLEKMLGVSRG